MGTLGKPEGTFSLQNSDKNVGSYFFEKDLKEILDLSDDVVDAVFKIMPYMLIDNERAINENDLYKKYKCLPLGKHIYKTRMSMDEIILAAIMKRTYPNMIIEKQFEVWKNRWADFKLTNDNHILYVEFDGPGHFAHTRNGKPDVSPLVRNKEIEDTTGIECVSWPYWIQRCETNVKALFDKKVIGLGALWSTNYHFGDFIFPNSAEVIEKITARFRAAENGYGYFYEKDSRGRIKPEHPILDMIRKGKAKKDKLLPLDEIDLERWLPSELT